ncbi:hypothetical protein [Cellulomonas gelida]|uniref:Uncharacterized protein n=1 Tax=Cellulomonas gelida TaxID=1712 RepID=A0A4Y3KJD4_9CELL|nr:hypothetical protein [Cellulomonas gelida]GEA83215.1 hypothetical protein CGE01nite_04660 [Cellulomonas gelida]GGL29287.1 hypothetical protein GCM10009774_19520 [Cellulomonas gelida]
MHAFLSFDLFQTQQRELQARSELARRRDERAHDLAHASSHPPERRRARRSLVAARPPAHVRAAF